MIDEKYDKNTYIYPIPIITLVTKNNMKKTISLFKMAKNNAYDLLKTCNLMQCISFTIYSPLKPHQR